MYTVEPARLSLTGRLARRIDGGFAFYATAATVVLAVILVSEAFARGWSQSWFVIVVYVLIAYLVLPRAHSALSAVYLPDYFIGRTRTREGLLSDPVNVAAVGSADQLHAVMRAGGWVLADDMGFRAAIRTIVATLGHRSYPSAPVSTMFLFGRRHAFCYQQEVDGTPGKRHHVRFWPTPAGWLLPGGRRVDWLAAGSFDRSVGLSSFTWQVTHRIAGEVDAERDHIVDTMRRADDSVEAAVIENFSTGYHSRAGGGDRIVTDGDLPVVDVRHVRATPAAHEQAVRMTATPRPLETTVGALLMLFRPVAAIVLIRAILTQHTVEGIRLPSGSGFTVAAIALTIAGVLAWIAIALGVLAGRGGARVVAMLVSGVAVATVAASWFHGSRQLTLEDGLAGFALDVAILFALSSRESRLWTQGRKRARRFRGQEAPVLHPPRWAGDAAA